MRGTNAVSVFCSHSFLSFPLHGFWGASSGLYAYTLLWTNHLLSTLDFFLIQTRRKHSPLGKGSSTLVITPLPSVCHSPRAQTMQSGEVCHTIAGWILQGALSFPFCILPSLSAPLWTVFSLDIGAFGFNPEIKCFVTRRSLSVLRSATTVLLQGKALLAACHRPSLWW